MIAQTHQNRPILLRTRLRVAPKAVSFVQKSPCKLLKGW